MNVLTKLEIDFDIISKEYLHLVYTAISLGIEGPTQFLVMSDDNNTQLDVAFFQVYDLQATL